jgi:phosphonate transport system permease protein
MNSPAVALPPRLKFPSFLAFLAVTGFATLITVSFTGWSISQLGADVGFEGVGASLADLIDGIPAMGRILGEMFPPDISRVSSVAQALLETLHMAVAGCTLGVLFALPVGVLASRSHSPHPLVYRFTRAVVSLLRTIPDLIWAIFFVISVGLGPFAGVLTLMVETIGFCGRFFAEAIEEIDENPVKALKSLGAGRVAVLMTAVFPAAMPSFVASSLYSLEKAVRHSVVLGLVGAGGIGVELKVAMDMFRYAEAATIIGMIFLLVMLVEQIGSAIRQRIQ